MLAPPFGKFPSKLSPVTSPPRDTFSLGGTSLFPLFGFFPGPLFWPGPKPWAFICFLATQPPSPASVLNIPAPDNRGFTQSFGPPPPCFFQLPAFRVKFSSFFKKGCPGAFPTPPFYFSGVAIFPFPTIAVGENARFFWISLSSSFFFFSTTGPRYARPLTCFPEFR